MYVAEGFAWPYHPLWCRLSTVIIFPFAKCITFKITTSAIDTDIKKTLLVHLIIDWLDLDYVTKEAMVTILTIKQSEIWKFETFQNKTVSQTHLS